MTLNTEVVAVTVCDGLEVFHKCRELLGATGAHPYHEKADSDWDSASKTWRENDVRRIGNEAGIGLDALLWVYYRPQLEPRRTPEESAAHDGDCEPDCDGTGWAHDPACWVEIHFDTTYGYHGPEGGCGALHARLLYELGQFATGWTKGRKWTTPSRPRNEPKYELSDRIRWEIRAAAWSVDLEPRPRISVPDQIPGQLELSGVIWPRNDNHRSASRSERSQSLHRVNPPEISLGHIETRVPELALQAVERDAFPARIDGEAVPELVRCQPTVHPASLLQLRELPSNIRRGHLVARAFASDDGEQCAFGDLVSDGQPVLNLPPSPLVHQDDSAFAALPIPDDDAALLAVQVEVVEREGFRDAEAGAVQHDQQRAEPHRAQFALSARCERDAVGEEDRELLGLDRVGRELAALVAVVPLPRWGDGRGLCRPGRGDADDGKVSLARHGGIISLVGPAEVSVGAVLPPLFRAGFQCIGGAA